VIALRTRGCQLRSARGSSTSLCGIAIRGLCGNSVFHSKVSQSNSSPPILTHAPEDGSVVCRYCNEHTDVHCFKRAQVKSTYKRKSQVKSSQVVLQVSEAYCIECAPRSQVAGRECGRLMRARAFISHFSRRLNFVFRLHFGRVRLPKDNMADEILDTVSTYYVKYVPQEAKTVMSAMSSDDWVALATCVLPLLCLIGAFIVQLFRCCGLCMPDGFDPTPAATLKDKYAKIEANKKPSTATKAAAKVAPAPAPAPKKASPPPAAAAKPTPAPKSGKGKLSA